MEKLMVISCALLMALPVFAEAGPKPVKLKPHAASVRKKGACTTAVKLKTEDQKTLYGLGLVVARQLAVFDLSEKELRIVKQGIDDGVKGRPPKADFAVYSKKSVELGIARRNAHGTMLAAKTPAYLEKAAQEHGAVKTASTAIYLPLREGEGINPVDTDKVKLHQRGMLIDGREIESSYKRGEPDVAELKEFIPCITEGVKMMKPGGKARLTCPPATAFGKEGSGVIPPDAALVFEVELLEVIKP